MAQRGSACFPIAMINACKYFGLRQPMPFEKLVDLAGCRYGSVIHIDKVLDISGLEWKMTYCASKVLKTQGILTIWELGVGMHAVFVFNEKGKTYAVNMNNRFRPFIQEMSQKPKDWPLPKYKNKYNRRHWICKGILGRKD